MSGVLVDTSVWVGHFRLHDAALARLLALDEVLVHPLVLGEIACGTPPQRTRTRTLRDLQNQQTARLATVGEALALIERERLHGLGCGVVDLLLLASTLLTPGAKLWTLDRRLAQLGQRFGVLYQPPSPTLP